jgi:two-component system response regulator ChvI
MMSIQSKRGTMTSHDGVPSGAWPGSSSEKPIRLVFVDDDDLYRDTVKADLVEQGFSVQAFSDGDEMFNSFSAGAEADIIILDWGLTKTQGIDLLPELRERGINLPVVFLTGRSSPTHESLAFGRGAIDFVDKARGALILGTRLRLVAQKKQPSNQIEPEQVLQCGQLVLKPRVSRAYWDNVDMHLTLTEFKIVNLLAANAGAYVTYRRIYDAMHYEGFLAGSGEDGYRTNVRSSIKRIRGKFKAFSADFDEIRNYNGFGYCWGEPNREAIRKMVE